MHQPDERDRRIRELEERLSLLSEAGLRITEDLDFNAVMQGVLESVRSLTAATLRRDHAFMTTRAVVQDYVFSGTD